MDAILKRTAARLGKNETDLVKSDFLPNEFQKYQVALTAYKKSKDKRSYASERRAYDLEHEFIEAMSRNFPCNTGYMEAQEAKGKTISSRLSDRKIFELYDIDENNIDLK